MRKSVEMRVQKWVRIDENDFVNNKGCVNVNKKLLLLSTLFTIYHHGLWWKMFI